MYQDRISNYQKLEESRDSKLLLYVTSDRRNLETQIADDVLPLITDHLDAIGDVERISLFLYTTGGDAMASWSIANLVRQFCGVLEVIVPAKAISGGTLICLGADQIVMTKQATLGPIDPSVNHRLNPQTPGAPPQARAPVSVEAITGYFEFLKANMGEDADVSQHALNLAGHVHPLVLGQAYRTRSQIRMLGEKLLSKQIDGGERTKKVIDFLCSESGSHDYTINRKEAQEELGLKVEKPNADLYGLIKEVQDDIREELELVSPFELKVFMGGATSRDYSFRRGLIESLSGGSHCFVSEGQFTKHQATTPQGGMQEVIQDTRSFEGWKYENPLQTSPESVKSVNT